MPAERPAGEGAAKRVVVSLDNEAEAITVHEQIALQEQWLRTRDADLREWMAKFVIPAFLKANAWTLIGLGVLVALDEFNIALHLAAPGDRIIGPQVIMTLLGATTVQVGVIAAVIARHLFPGRR